MEGASKKDEKQHEEGTYADGTAEQTKKVAKPKVAIDAKKERDGLTQVIAKVRDLDTSVSKLTDMVKNLEMELDVSPKMSALSDPEASAIQALLDDVKNRYKGKVSKWQQTPFALVEDLLNRRKKG